MPATPGTISYYAAGLAQYLAADIPVTDAGCFKALLVDASYVPDKEAHTDLTDITNEVYGDSWPEGGVTLTGVSVTIVQASDLVKFSFDAISVTPASVDSAKRLIIYHALPAADADKTLFAYITFDTALSPSYGPIAIAAPDGLFTAGY